MSKNTAALVISVIALLTALYSTSDKINVSQFIDQNLRQTEQLEEQDHPLNLISFEAPDIIEPWMYDECTQSMVIDCAASIESTVKTCSKAYADKGKNIQADLACIKDLMADRKRCWPCICAEAQKRGWKVWGC